MSPDEIQSLLQPGDCLLYRPSSLYGRLIAIKTWHNIAHCELYVGNGRSAASRDGKGVALYPWRNTELAYILRPSRRLDWVSFWPWFQRVNGEKYDWLGLLRFVWFKQIGSNPHRMFCSEFLTRAYRVLGVSVFGSTEDADAVAPFEFLLSTAFTVIGTPWSVR